MTPVPHLITALTGPLLSLEKKILDNQDKIEIWLSEQWRNFPPPVTCSVDVRNAGYKVAPVDTNLFPAGFNNLNPVFWSLSSTAFLESIQSRYPGVKRILIIPESHSRNENYYRSLRVLQMLVQQAGFETRLGSLSASVTQEVSMKVDEHTLTLQPVIRSGDSIWVENFEPELILLNNDCSEGVPDILQNCAQPIEVPTKLGWAHRFKSSHFSFYQSVAREFSDIIDSDPWFIDPLFRVCGDINFMTQDGLACLKQHSGVLLDAIREKYQEYGISEKPFIVIKADTGTYGMAVMMIHDVSELDALNRKQRKKMAAGKGSVKTTQVILQEGVPTVERFGELNGFAEPVVYMIGRNVVGGFYRVHNARTEFQNLNAPGMEFRPLAFATPCDSPSKLNQQEDAECVNRFYTYGVIARLALLAAAKELAEVL